MEYLPPLGSEFSGPSLPENHLSLKRFFSTPMSQRKTGNPLGAYHRLRMMGLFSDIVLQGSFSPPKSPDSLLPDGKFPFWQTPPTRESA